MRCPLILPLFVAICEACLLKLTYGAHLILFLKSGVTIVKYSWLKKIFQRPHIDHYTTTPRIGMDDLTLKVDTATGDLTLKTYSVRLLQTL